MDNKVKDLTKVSFGIATMFLLFWIYKFFIGKLIPIADNLRVLIGMILLYTVGLYLFIYITKGIKGSNYKKRNYVKRRNYGKINRSKRISKKI